MSQRELADFRTPQHPSLGTNHWGAASPLLARNIPKESLEQKYLKLNSIRTREEIFPAEYDDFNYLTQLMQTNIINLNLQPQRQAAAVEDFSQNLEGRRRLRPWNHIRRKRDGYSPDGILVIGGLKVGVNS